MKHPCPLILLTISSTVLICYSFHFQHQPQLTSGRRIRAFGRLLLASTKAPVEEKVKQSDIDSGSNGAVSTAGSVALNASNSTEEVSPRARRPPFPPVTYPLSTDEDEMDHKFVSFVDQSFLAEYSQTVRLIEPRLYASGKAYQTTLPPTIDDVADPASRYSDLATAFAWNGILARMVVGTAAYLSFPYVIKALQEAIGSSIDSSDLAILIGTFLPGISIVLGTYFSLTISILYSRFTEMQEAIGLEASQLSLTFHNLLLLNRDSPGAAVEGAQCVADQIRTLVYDSRGRETMGVIYNDPYARILTLLQDYELKHPGNSSQLLSNLYDSMQSLFEMRSKRMSYEALALAPTHYDVMTFLCILLMSGYVLGTVATCHGAAPSGVSSVLFAALTVCYTISYEMSFDLNRPFDGIYQIRRSGPAMHFLQMKQVIQTHPLLKGQVSFDAVEDKIGAEILDCDAECRAERRSIWYN